MRRFGAAAALPLYLCALLLPGQTITLDTFDDGTATGAVVASPIATSWVSQVTQNAESITVGGSARDDNGWGVTGVSIDATAMSYVRITGRLEAGNLTPTLVVQFDDEMLNSQIVSVSSAAFVDDASTQVQIPIGTWNLNAANIESWSIGGGNLGLVAFRMSLEDLALSSALVSLSGGGRIVTAGDQVYTSPVTLDAATTLGTIGSNGNAITFNTTIDGAHALTLNTPGATTLAGAVGGDTPLASLETDAGGTTAINGGAVTTSGAQVYRDDVSLGADTHLTSTAAGVDLIGDVDGNGHSLTLEIADASVFQSASDLAALTKVGAGMLTLTGLSSFTGNVAINAGTLELGLDNALMGENALSLAGGVLATGGFDQTFGELTLDGSSTIDFGHGFSALTFAASQSIGWTGTLSILNFTLGEDTLRFGTSVGALTASQLNTINFGSGLVASIDANGFVTGISAVPEPSTYAAMAGCLALAGAVWRRRARGRSGESVRVHGNSSASLPASGAES